MSSPTNNAGPTSRHSVRVDTGEVMAAYDALPRPIRERIANAAVNFNTTSALALYQGGEPIPSIIRRIDEAEQRILAARRREGATP